MGGEDTYAPSYTVTAQTTDQPAGVTSAVTKGKVPTQPETKTTCMTQEPETINSLYISHVANQRLA